MGHAEALEYALKGRRIKLYHGTSAVFGLSIAREGLSPEGPRLALPGLRKSSKSESGYIYFFEDIKLARYFGCGTAARTIGNKVQIFAIDPTEVSVEKDPLLPSGSWRHFGWIPPEKLESIEIIPCKKEWMNDYRKRQ